MKPSHMKTFLVVALILCGAVGASLIFMGEVKEGLIFLGGTLVTLIIAVLFGYPQYLAAREAYIPVITAELEDVEDEPYNFKVVLQSHSNQMVRVLVERIATYTTTGTPFKLEPLKYVDISPLGKAEVVLFSKETVESLLKEVFDQKEDIGIPVRIDITVHSLGLKTGAKGDPLQTTKTITFSLN